MSKPDPWDIAEWAGELALGIVRAIRAGKTTREEVEASLPDVIHPRRGRPPGERPWEEALEERRRRQDEDTQEFPVVERHEPEGSSER